MMETQSTYRPVRWDITKIFRDVAAKGWTMAKLSDASGVSKMTIINLRRVGKPTPTTMAKIAKALKQPIDRYILED